MTTTTNTPTVIPQSPPISVSVRQYEVIGRETREIDAFTGSIIGWKVCSDAHGDTDYVAVVWSDGPMAMALDCSAGTVWKVDRR